ncbi:MAG: GAF and ANTAR domain-containing protein [Acidimicrobiales bacterium]|jgi:hypothetical protein
MTRQDLLSRTFVELADTLVESYDPIEFLHRLAERCVSLLGVAEAGVVLVGPEGQLRPLASSSERMHLIELIEVQREDGPCLDCWRSGEAVREDELAESRERWPRFGPAALEAGFLSAYALPMRLREERIGALNLFSNHAYGLIQPDEAIAQAMADVATIGILHERFIRQREEVSEQLRAAFNARVALEQAKGIVAEATGTDVDAAFALMRGYTRRHRLLLSEVARQLISRELAVEAMRSQSGTSRGSPR